MSREVLYELRAGVGFARLNRPEALNALTLGMVRSLARRLSEWAEDPTVDAVVLEGAGRAFCAGGDVRSLCEAGPAGDPGRAERFFREEYLLDCFVARYPKPVIAVLDGIAMGGGVGLTVHCPYRVVTERTRLAMPETGIGFFPDVGATYFLPRLPGRLGLYLGLTGATLGPAELLECGLATHYIPSPRLPAWRASLRRGEIDPLCASFAQAPPDGEARVDSEPTRCFDASSLPETIGCLVREGTPRADRLLASLALKSPTSLAVTFRQLTDRAAADLDGALRLEYRMARRFLRGQDFYEGVRAALVDKDQAPRWDPATLGDLQDDDVESYFEPLDAAELDLP